MSKQTGMQYFEEVIFFVSTFHFGSCKKAFRLDAGSEDSIFDHLSTQVEPFPRDPITLSDDDWGLQSPPQQGI